MDERKGCGLCRLGRNFPCDRAGADGVGARVYYEIDRYCKTQLCVEETKTENK